MGWNINWFRRKKVYLPSDELKCTVEDDTIYGKIELETILCKIEDDQVTGAVQEEIIKGYAQNEEINQNIK